MAVAERILAAPTDIAAEMAEIGRSARAAARRLANASTADKNKALLIAAAALRRNEAAILAENALDVAGMKKEGAAASFLDRLTLTHARIATVTIAAYIGLGGLGQYIITGLELRRIEVIIGGAILVAVLALVLDGVFAVLQRVAVPRGVLAGQRSTASSRTRAPRVAAA